MPLPLLDGVLCAIPIASIVCFTAEYLNYTAKFVNFHGITFINYKTAVYLLPQHNSQECELRSIQVYLLKDPQPLIGKWLSTRYIYTITHYVVK